MAWLPILGDSSTHDILVEQRPFQDICVGSRSDGDSGCPSFPLRPRVNPPDREGIGHGGILEGLPHSRQLSGEARMKWQFFFGACFLTGALLFPHVKTWPVIAGMALAGLVQWGWSRTWKDPP